jgi:nucleotide-binding universal stress UspA family protein
MFDKILVALEPKESNTQLFEEAIALAKATDAQLNLVSILTSDGYGSLPPIVYPGLMNYAITLEESAWQDYQTCYQAYQEENLTKLRHLSEQAIAAGVCTEFMQKSGSPGRTICDLAQSWAADLVMVGSRGRKGLSSMFLGSVSNYVMHHANCSVMVVHPHIVAAATPDSSCETRILAA